MSRHDETKAAIIEYLRSQDADPSKPISLYLIGLALVPNGFSQDELVDALYSLQDDSVIELMEGNRVRVIKSLT